MTSIHLDTNMLNSKHWILSEKNNLMFANLILKHSSYEGIWEKSFTEYSLIIGERNSQTGFSLFSGI